MEEKTYKLLGGSGALNIAVGAVVLVSGIASGVLLNFYAVPGYR